MKAICILILVLLIGSVAAQGTKFNADSRFTEEQKKSLETGNARLTCNLSCAFSYGLAARKLIQLHDTENWDELIFEVVNLGYEKNLTYYYLGRAFEGKGNLDAAEKYYKLGLGTSQKCSYGRCEGLVFPDVISSRLLNLNKSSSSATNYISKPKSDFILPVGWTEKPVPTSLKNAGVEFVAMNTSIQAAFRYWTLDKESLVNIPSFIKKMPQNVASDLKSATVGEIEELEVNGNKAYRFEVTGIPADSKSQITYLITFVEGSKYLVRSDAMIEAKDYPVFKDYLAKLVFGFRSDDLKNTRISSINSAPAVSDSQRQAIEQRERQIELEAGQSKLSACQGSDESRWTNCFGSWAYSSGIKYVGEYKNGKPNGQGTFRWPEGHKHVGEIKDGIRIGQGTLTFPNGDKYVGEWKDGSYNGRGIFYKADGSIKESGIYKDDKLVTSQYIDPNSFTRIARNNTAPEVSDSQRQAIEQRERQIELEAQRLAEERRKLDEDKRQRELAKQSNRISITATATQPDSSGVVTINIQTNTDTSSLKINGEELGGKPDGSYSVKRVARVGQETKFVLAATDVYGNTDSKTITVVRQAVDSKAVFTQLNAANIKQQPARDAVAIIIGIEKYKRVAKADFANADAQDFYDYASRALGIKPENIKLLVDDGADDLEILQAFQKWLPLKVKKGKTDVYVFFSGHGYPSEDGKGLYFLPYGVDKNYMDRTAVKQKEVVTALQAVQPKSVTMFIDSCYSGQTRGGETLVAGSKPIALKQSETAYPPEFTVITASTMDQISWSSPDLKHGLFSYYLMKGMEGDSDLNKDGKVTVAEMQEYLTDMVGRHAMGMNRNQQPQLFGDPNKVLISR